MPELTIKHVTTYHYRQPVSFGEHWMMLRPIESDDQRLRTAKLSITPTPISIRVRKDVFGNHVAVARFAGRATELRFESTACVDPSSAEIRDFDIDECARVYPFAYRPEERPDLRGFAGRQHADPERQLERWTRTFLRKDRATNTREFLIN